MDSIVLFLKEGTLPGEKGKIDKYKRKLLIFGYPMNKSCTNVRFLDRTCYVSISK